jgi:predicted lipoprotein
VRLRAPRAQGVRRVGSTTLGRRTMAALALALVVTGALVAGSCSSGGTGSGDGGDGGTAPESTDRQAVVTQVVEQVVGPDLRAAADAADAAVRSVEDYCATPTPAGLAAAVDAVDGGIAAYERLDPIDMGPIMVNRTDGQVAYPVDAERVEELIAQGPPTDVLTVNERTPSSTRGLTTAEHLLGRPVTPGDDPALCAYLVAITTNAADEIAEVVVDSFEGSRGNTAYFNRLTGAAADAHPPQDVLNIVVNMAMTVLDSDAKLLADPSDVPEAAVRRAAASHLATLAEVWGTSSSGLGQLVNGELATRVSDELHAAFEAVDDESVPLTDALAAVEAARATIGTEVVSALDIVVGFSENDGDS